MNCFVGIDIQTSRGCPFAIIDANGVVIDDGWIQQSNPAQMVADLRDAVRACVPADSSIALAVDAPRNPLSEPRKWYWKSDRWRESQLGDQGAGRHCEIVIAAHRLANPQWTPCRGPFPGWMELGFMIFQKLGAEFPVFEVFPSASYKMFQSAKNTTISIRLGRLAPGPKDMLDAYIAAATLREFLQGRGCEVGDGDGLGSIILPLPLGNPIDKVLSWPPR